MTGSDSIVFYSGSSVQGSIESYSTGGLAGLVINGPNSQRLQLTTGGSVQLIPGGTGGTLQFFDRDLNAISVINNQGLFLSPSSPTVSSFFARNIRGYTSFTSATNTDGAIGDIALVYTP